MTEKELKSKYDALINDVNNKRLVVYDGCDMVCAVPSGIVRQRKEYLHQQEKNRQQGNGHCRRSYKTVKPT